MTTYDVNGNEVSVIPYDAKLAIALDSLQTFVETCSSIRNDIEQQQQEVNKENIPSLAIIAVQDRVNQCMLEVIERILGPNYNQRTV